MPIPEHLEILNQGVKAWNEWRTGNPDVVPDLSGISLLLTNEVEVGFGFAPIPRDLRAINFKDANLQKTNIGPADLQGADLRGAKLQGADLREAKLQGAKLGEANLEGANLQLANLQAAHLPRSRAKGASLQGADLTRACAQEAQFPAAELQDALLREADLQNANLQQAKLQGADLSGADLREADLQGANLQGANLKDAKLREADLRGANLSNVQGGLRPEQLAGADLTGAKLPGPIDKLFEDLKAVGDISESARKLFVAMLAACLYSWLTIATTTDVNLITNRASSPLPIIQTSIPIVGFYVVAPLLVLCVYFYFHFYLQKLWEELGSLPAIFPDGRPLHARSDPWLLNDLVRSHLAKLKPDRPLMSYFQQLISIVLAWGLVPFTLLWFWVRYLRKHDLAGTTFHVLLAAISITAAVFLYRLAAGTLRGDERRSFSWSRAVKSPRAYSALAALVATGVAFLLVSLGGIRGARNGWVPRAMALVHYSPFANLRDADVSVKPPNWTGKNDSELDLVKGAELSFADLRYADAPGAFLVKAVLSESHLEGADLLMSDLRGANLSGAYLGEARLRSANLTGANLSGAHLARADLSGASLHGAQMSVADLRGANMGGGDITAANLRGTNLSTTDLSGANLSGAQLSGADLTGAELVEANLSRAILARADLRRADLQSADLRGAQLSDADLEFADFRTPDFVDPVAPPVVVTTRINPDALKSALNRNKAYYDSDLLQKLGLPPDHNEKLAEEQKQEERNQEEQKKNVSAVGSTGASVVQKPSASGKSASPKQGNK
jgi:uncharacterized protein YjbI with pentapeptide repeats